MNLILATAAVLAASGSGAITDGDRPVVAIAEVRVSTAAAQLHFSEDAVRDALTTALHGKKTFAVWDWNRLSAVVLRRSLEDSDLANGNSEGDADDGATPVEDMLFNDYFLLCTVSHYSERIDYKPGVVRASKSQTAEIELHLILKDAMTNEVVASTTGEASTSRKVTRNLGFGVGGGAASTLSKEALNKALDQALDELIGQMPSKSGPVAGRSAEEEA